MVRLSRRADINRAVGTRDTFAGASIAQYPWLLLPFLLWKGFMTQNIPTPHNGYAHDHGQMMDIDSMVDADLDMIGTTLLLLMNTP